MTVSTTKNAEYAVGNGITTSFPFYFVTLDASHIYVYVNGSKVTTGFTVSVNLDQSNNPGGSVDFDVAVSSGDEVAILRIVPLDQLVDYTTYDRFPAEVHESALDKLTMLVQQTQNSVDGTFGFSQVVSDAGETKIFLSAADRAGKLLSFDSNGNLIATQEVGSWRGDWSTPAVYYERDIWRDSAGDLYYVHTQHTAVSEADSITKSAILLDVSIVTDAANTATTKAAEAETSASAAANSASNAATSETNAANSAAAAAASETASKTSETNAAASAAAAKASEDDVAANAAAAANSEANALSYKNSAASSASAAGSYANSANDSRAKASLWAEAAEDSAVEPGKYSAKHHAAKASASASSASMSATNAANYRDTANSHRLAAADSASQAASSATAASNSASAAATSETNAADSAAEAAGYAAGVNLPSAAGNGGRFLRQKGDETGFEYTLGGPGSGLNADLLDGLHGSQVCRRVDLSSQVQVYGYRRSVIALCELTNANTIFNSWSAGTIDFHRSNGLSHEARIDYSMSKKYNTTQPNFSSIYRGLPETSCRPCTFVYGGVKYGGIEFYYSDAGHGSVIWLGTGNFEPFGIDYYDTRGTVLNSEVNDSLNFSDPIISDHLYINSKRIYHAGNSRQRIVTLWTGSAYTGSFSIAAGRRFSEFSGIIILAKTNAGTYQCGYVPYDVLASGKRLTSALVYASGWYYAAITRTGDTTFSVYYDWDTESRMPGGWARIEGIYGVY